MSTDTGRNIHNSTHISRLESRAIIVRKGEMTTKEQKVATVRPSCEKKNRIINPSVSPEKITSRSQPNLLLAIELEMEDCMVLNYIKERLVSNIFFLTS
jgi:hypothetical protein